jgi:MarR family 2-MHQ and catechol resistance regulon transcriptional repressor
MKTPKRSPNPGTAAPAMRPSPMDDLPTATALKLWVVMARATAAIGEVVKSQVEPYDLTPTEFSILEALYHKGPLLLGEVQKKVLVSSGGITFLVDRLETRGFVERRACPSDRRARYAALTKRGTKLMADIFPAHAAVIREAMGALSRAEQRQVTGMLKALGKGALRRDATAAGSGAATPREA